ncbi:hypothetical protein [Streptomyces sp. 7N604]|uniref:hypothetical protein n=1 Tax=Streptomyces sp. 7N604 TaxID=3457415 RepID=UPI003FD1B4A9
MAAPRKVLLGVATSAMALAVSGCSGGVVTKRDPDEEQKRFTIPKGPTAARVRLIGDGSTADTGRQPLQPAVERLRPGERPPQFVVFSWDGAGEDSQKLFSRFRAIGNEYDARMTYFLSGVYVLPHEKRRLYEPPKHARGASDIGFNDIKGIRATLEQVRLAWLEGNEIGTHFNGHFCGPNGGVGTWSPAEWKSEIEQAEWFVKRWRTNSGLKNMTPLPFDYSKELVGGRAPCLEGQKNLIPAAKAMGFRYDASSSGGRQVWPDKIDGIWDFPLQEVPLAGRTFETLSMDYNFLANQSGTVRGDPSRHKLWGKQMRDGLLAAFDRAYNGNRAPFFIGNHFESWNGGTYMRAVEDTIKAVCRREGVRCVTFKQLADWLDAQDPEVLERLRSLEVGEKPEEGWAAFLGARPAAPAGPGRPAEESPAERSSVEGPSVDALSDGALPWSKARSSGDKPPVRARSSAEGASVKRAGERKRPPGPAPWPGLRPW